MLTWGQQVALWRRAGHAAEVLAEVGEMLERVGVDAGAVTAEELPHIRWLSPGVWRICTSAGRLEVLKYTRSERSRGSTPWEARWTARNHDPRRCTYWCREPLAYQHDLAGAYSRERHHRADLPGSA